METDRHSTEQKTLDGKSMSAFMFVFAKACGQRGIAWPSLSAKSSDGTKPQSRKYTLAESFVCFSECVSVCDLVWL